MNASRVFARVKEFLAELIHPSINLFMVRHAHSQSNQNKELHFTTADNQIDLSEVGYAQLPILAQAMVKALPAGTKRVVLWTTSYTRGRHTSRPIVKELTRHGIEVEVREQDSLVELNYGLFDGHEDDALREKFPQEAACYFKWLEGGGMFFAARPLGQSWQDLALRVDQVIQRIQAEFKQRHAPLRLALCRLLYPKWAHRYQADVHIVVSHGVTIRVMAKEWLGHSAAWVSQLKNPKNASVWHVKGTQSLGFPFPGFRNGKLDIADPIPVPDDEAFNYHQ